MVYSYVYHDYHTLVYGAMLGGVSALESSIVSLFF